MDRTCTPLTSEETLNALKDGIGLRMNVLKLFNKFHTLVVIGGTALDLQRSLVNSSYRKLKKLHLIYFGIQMMVRLDCALFHKKFVGTVLQLLCSR